MGVVLMSKRELNRIDRSADERGVGKSDGHIAHVKSTLINLRP
jgi:hypothetical protein